MQSPAHRVLRKEELYMDKETILLIVLLVVSVIVVGATICIDISDPTIGAIQIK